MKIMKYRLLMQDALNDETKQRIRELVKELEQKLRKIDE